MNEIPITSLRPGTVLTVSSTGFPLIRHWGVVGYGRDSQGYPRVWHSQKSDTLRCTDFEVFSAGQQCSVEGVLDSWQANRAISRLQSKEGLPWHLTQANCEMVVRWAVEDTPRSQQLEVGALAVLATVVGIAVFSSNS
jgi:hypothetical protein